MLSAVESHLMVRQSMKSMMYLKHLQTVVRDGRVRMGRVVFVVAFALLATFNIFSATPRKPVRPMRPGAVAVLPDSIPLSQPILGDGEVVEDAFTVTPDSLDLTPVDSIAIVPGASMAAVRDSLAKHGLDEPIEFQRSFNPDPMRAVWLSALCPGLGQIYNRRFWKLPLVVAGYLGLAYGTSWNNMMLTDYTKAYADLLDADPSTNSYMDFFPPTVSEESLNKQWLTNVMKSRKNFYRRNRDLCIIGMIGVYFLAMIDAYVDASLSHFDISPDLFMDVAPALIPDSRNTRPGIGLAWAITF